jgi:hypothetical protein
VIAKKHHEEGGSVRKTYQNEQLHTSRSAVPESVSVALAELAEDMREAHWRSRWAPGCRYWAH